MNTFNIANSHNESEVVSSRSLINAADLAVRILLSIIFLIAGVVAAFLLAGFTLLAGTTFRHDFANKIQMLICLKDLVIAGGFLLLVVKGTRSWILDQRKRHHA